MLWDFFMCLCLLQRRIEGKYIHKKKRALAETLFTELTQQRE